MSWLITGGCGFVGTNLADALLGQGVSVALLDNMSGRGAAENLRWLRERHGSDWPMLKIDVRDAAALAAAVRNVRPQFVAHLAGQVAMTTSVANPRLDFETNALGTFNLLEAIRSASPGTAVLYSSTNKVYGNLEHLRYDESPTRYLLADHPHGLDESLQLDGSSPYGCSKLCADQYCRDYHRMYGIRTVVFRHSSMYGGRQFASYDQGWIGWFCGEALAAARDKRPIEICGNGKQVRDVLHASDLVQVYLHAARSIDAIAGRIFNIGGGMANSLSLAELLSELGRMIGAELAVVNKPWRAADQKVFVADCRRAERDFNWRPTVDFRQGLTEMLDWIRELCSLRQPLTSCAAL
jgi:CDP-paratose 2-epimerase